MNIRPMGAGKSRPAASGPSKTKQLSVARFSAGGKPELNEALKESYRDVGPAWMLPDQLPIVYNEAYNITFGGLEKLHPFDSCKFRKVVTSLTQQGYFTHRQLVTPAAATLEMLGDVHSSSYLQKLESSAFKVAEVTELAPLALLPMFYVRSRVLQPMRCHVGGTVLAVGLAAVQGWAVNLGGGMHHAHHADGSGWCPYDDIMLAIRRVRRASKGVIQRVLVIDVDAHQGNGVARDKLHFDDGDTRILDVFNAQTWPRDQEAKKGIDIKVELPKGCRDEEYLSALDAALAQASSDAASGRHLPDLLIYNAGTDVLVGDPIGKLGVSEQGVLLRDRRVFEWAAQHRVPLCMLLSGGYSQRSAAVIVESMKSLLTGERSEVLDH